MMYFHYFEKSVNFILIVYYHAFIFKVTVEGFLFIFQVFSFNIMNFLDFLGGSALDF